MRRIWLVALVCLTLVFGVAGTAAAEYTNEADTILEGEVLYSPGHYFAGDVIPLSKDAYGYNYQGHLFAGKYANVYLGGDGLPPYDGDAEAYEAANPSVIGKWYWEYRDAPIVMEWNDAWLANSDADGDGLLDRHLGFTTYIDSGAWLTNRGWGYTCKIAAMRSTDELVDGVWYTDEGVEIGPSIWGQFAIIQESGVGIPQFMSDAFLDFNSK